MIGRKIKIALCLSGEPRNSMFSFPYMYESILSLNNDSNFEVDTFIHFSKTFRAFNLYNSKKYLFEPFLIADIIPYILKLKYPPELKSIFSYDLFNTTNSNNLVNQIRMLKNVQTCFNLAKSYSKYDIVIRCRPDIYFNKKINLKYIIQNIIMLKKYDIFIPKKDTIDKTPHNEYSDQFAVGNFKSMEIYSDMFNNIESLLFETKNLKAEIWYKNYLDSKNLKIHEEILDSNLVRDIHVCNEKRCPDTNFISE